MEQIKILALLKEATVVDFKRRNEIAAEINHAAHEETGECVAIFNMLYVQFCQEAPMLLPHLFPLAAAIAGDREEGLFANRIDMGMYTFMLNLERIRSIEDADRARILREHNHRGRGDIPRD